MAKLLCAVAPPPAGKKRVAMVAYTGYESDNRVRRYAEALARRGDSVDVIAVSSRDVPMGLEELNGVRVFRVQRRNFDEKHKWAYVWRLLRFLWVASTCLNRLHRRAPYDIVHVHNVPDFLVFSAWFPKLTGAKLILDVHDIVPEFFASKFGTTTDNPYVRLLKLVEKASAAFVDHVIVSNDLWRQRLVSRSVPAEKCSVFLNHVDPALFQRHYRTRNDGKFVMMFPGTFQWHQGIDIAIEALAHLKDRVPTAELHLYGAGTPDIQTHLAQLAERLGVRERVIFGGGVPFERMAEVMANADVGVVPKRADSFGNEAYSTKIMEFMSQGVPVVVSRTKIDSFYFSDSVVRFFASGDSKAMAESIVSIMENKALQESLAAKGLEYADQNNWDRKKQDYFQLVDSLTVEGFGDSNLAGRNGAWKALTIQF